MFKLKKSKRITSLLLTFCFVFCLTACGKSENEQEEKVIPAENAAAAVKFSDSAASLSKTETVFINLDSNGTLKTLSVNDRLHTEKGGVFADDISDLKDIANVKSDIVPEKTESGLRWHMPSPDLYYSGKTSKKPPVEFEISYYLNCKKTAPEKAAGKSGEIKIEIKMKNSLSKEVSVEGKKRKVYLPMLVVGGMILPQDGFSAVKISSGTSISDGSKEIAVFCGFPGLAESLGLTAEGGDETLDSLLSSTVSVTAQATEFELGNMYFAAIPIASLDLGGGLTSAGDDIGSVISVLKKLQSALSKTDPQKLIALLSSNKNGISSLAGILNDSITLLKNNQALLDLLSKYSSGSNREQFTSLISVLTSPDIQKALSSLDKNKLDALINADPQALSNLLQTASKAANLYNKNKELFDLLSRFINNGGASELSEVLEGLNTPEAKSALALLSDESFGELIGAVSKLGGSIDLLSSLSEDLQTEEMQKVLNDLPKTLGAFDKLQKAISENSELIDSLTGLFDENGLSALTSAADVMGDEEFTSLLTKYSGLTQSGENTAALAEEWLNFGKSYKIFTLAPENAQTSVSFIYQTQAVKYNKPAENDGQAVEEEGRIEAVFRKIKDVF